ncbi:unnamed protein product [Cylindrotheca closterium]|uniref:SET domain-containing protein n=1 Tax=Cylindrotheca closterium TaxID=2856 RepID=A0AAD2FS65_9STRA|nr:unnamed protein product [Cylindrotheca closterium]
MEPNHQRGSDNKVKEKHEYVKGILSEKSNGFIQCFESENEGLYVTATNCRNLRSSSAEPTRVMTCQAAAIALDPPFRQTHCSFCASSGTTLYALEGCSMVSACTSCGPLLMKDGYHRSNEFAILEKMEATFGPSIDSIFVLTVRLLCCQSSKDWWKLFCRLYEHPTDDSMEDNIDLICSHLPAPANDKGLFRETLGRVLGCSHNITDFSRPLGNQSLGRAIFLEHSFYNHSCVPNAYLSCNIRHLPDGSAISTLTADVHLLETVQEGDEITISYIPMSGLSTRERRKTLQEGYGFDCNCRACTSLEPAISITESMDVQSLREIQYNCNERLLTRKNKEQQPSQSHTTRMQRSNQEGDDRASSEKDGQADDEVDQVIALVQMTQRGIRNQGIPETHEVSVESHRLLALAYSILEDWVPAKEHHENFLKLANKVNDLFDPVALGLQLLEYANALKQVGDREITRSARKRQEGLSMLQRALGKNHDWLAMLSSEESSPPRDTTPKRKSDDTTSESDELPDKRSKVKGDS